MTLTIISSSETETEHLGRCLGQLLRPGDVLALVGTLGAGKTCLARGIARGLGVTDPVTSPTFILIAQYNTPAGFPLYHADCYRLADPEAEALDIGLDEIMDDGGVCVVEWAERIETLLPADHLRITLVNLNHESRQLIFQPSGARGQQLMAELQERLTRAGR